MNSTEMRNIKKPAYAVEMGSGLFAGTVIYQCKKCGLTLERPNGSGVPGGLCPKGGAHQWVHTIV